MMPIGMKLSRILRRTKLLDRWHYCIPMRIFPLPTVEALKQLGHDVVTARENDQANQRIPDRDVLINATAQDRAVITLNRRDFIGLHRINPEHAGIIVCKSDGDFVALAQRIDTAIQASPDLHRQLLRVNRPG